MSLMKSMVFLALFSVPAYSFSAPDIEVGFSPEGSAQVLVAARQRGVDVRVVVDNKRNQVTASKTIMS